MLARPQHYGYYLRSLAARCRRLVSACQDRIPGCQDRIPGWQDRILGGHDQILGGHDWIRGCLDRILGYQAQVLGCQDRAWLPLEGSKLSSQILQFYQLLNKIFMFSRARELLRRLESALGTGSGAARARSGAARTESEAARTGSWAARTGSGVARTGLGGILRAIRLPKRSSGGSKIRSWRHLEPKKAKSQNFEDAL